LLAGQRVESERFTLSDIRAYARESIAMLPAEHRSLAPPAITCDVAVSAELARCERETRERLQAREARLSQK
jgi:hypothetical protein